MDFAPAWLCARECLDCTLQRAVRARRTRLVPRRIRARQKRLQRLSRHSDTSDCSERLAKKERSDPEQCANFIELRFLTMIGAAPWLWADRVRTIDPPPANNESHVDSIVERA